MGRSAEPSRPSLHRDRILQAAISVADADGLDAVTIRRVAAELGVHFSSLYTHVESKEAIFDGMVEALIAEAAIPLHHEDWQSWIRMLAGALRRLARAHPGAVYALTRAPATSPLAIQQTESALSAFRRGGFSAPDAGDAVAGTSLALLGLALNESATGRGQPPHLAALSAAEFPNLYEAASANTDSSSVWRMIVEGLIVGLEHRRGS